MPLEKSEPDACRQFYIGSIGKSMHWYKRNIGDYAKKAGRLTMLQHGSYTLLMDACYDRERFPTLEQAIEWTWASTSDEVESLKFVLAKFFTLGANGVYTQDRILGELIDYHGKADKNKQIAIDRETKRKENRTNRAQRVHEAPRVENEAPPNQEPVTNNHKPVANEIPDGFALFWSAYPKKTAKPAALKAFKAKKINGELQTILADIDRRASSPDWQKDGGQYIPNPATYLNNRRWEDQTEQKTANIWAGAI